MVPPTQRHRELIADLAPQRPGLRKAQVVGVGRAATANEAWLLSNRFDMLPIANATRRRQSQYSFVDTYCLPWFPPALTGLRHWPVNQILLSPWNKGCEFCLKHLLHVFSIHCSERVFARKSPMSPVGGVVGAAKVVQLGYQSVAQSG